MKKLKNKHTTAYLLICYSAILLMFTSCKAQEKNPEYLGIKYGVFDLDKITFLENVDMLFSKVEKYYKRPVDDGYFDEKLKKFMTTDTLYYTYRVSPKLVTQGMFKFKDFNIKSNEAIDFYMDKARNFRRIEVSVYMNAQQYKELRSATKDFKDITPENVKRVNNHKYIIPTVLFPDFSDLDSPPTIYPVDVKARVLKWSSSFPPKFFSHSILPSLLILTIQ
jgi:hypothetical protein